MMAPLIESVPRLAGTRDEERWRAMVARSYEATANLDPFVIAVRTTGIYCRVGCPARTPHRHNVHFFDTIAGARAAGYRACKRCHPDKADLRAWRSNARTRPRAA